MNLYPNIIYDKNNIIISEIDLKYYKQLYFENFNQNLNDAAAIKKIVITKKLIENLKKNNPFFLSKIDEALIKEYGIEKMNIEILKDFIRYFKIKNEYINEFYQTKFNINDLKSVFDSFDKIELPISDNNCLTISSFKDFKNDMKFLNNFYKNLKEEIKRYETEIENVIYNVCIDSKTYQIFEYKILNYIENVTENDFKKFVYEKQ